MIGYYKNLRQCHEIIIKCSCGSAFQQVHQKNHFLTDRHQNFINGAPDKINFLDHPWKFFSCPCGQNVLKHNMNRHLKKHLNIKIDT
jgi:hypothetical protein